MEEKEREKDIDEINIHWPIAVSNDARNKLDNIKHALMH